MIDLQQYNSYYSNETVLYEIVKQLRGRETTLIGWDIDGQKEYIFRCIKAHSLEFLQKNFQAFNFSTRLYNIYRSVAILKDMPMFNWNMEKRMEEQQQFNRNFTNYLEDFDLVFDFDCEKNDEKGYHRMWQDVSIVKDLFKDYCLPYTLKASSFHGFHIEVPASYLSGTPTDKLLFSLKFARSLKQLFALDSLDLKIYNYRRIFRVAYSLNINDGSVALPLTNEQFNNLYDNKAILLPENVLPTIQNRGLLIEGQYDSTKMKQLLDSMEEEELVVGIR